MSNQIQTKLGDVADIITGPFGSQLHKSDYVQSGIACIMPQNIGNRTLNKQGIAYVSLQDANRLKRYAVRQNDIVYARRGDVEKHAYIYPVDSDSLCGTGCMRVRVDSTKAAPLYVSFYLNRPETKRWISQHAVGSNMPNINSGILNDVPLSLPTLYEQTQISKFLEAIDQKIANSNHICAELESMAKTLYDYWFVQFDFPDENGRPYRTSGGEMVWNDQLKREIPKGWSVHRIQDVCEIVDCLHSKKPDLAFEDDKYFLLQLENLVDLGLLDLSQKYYVSKQDYENWTSKIEVRDGDIVITNAGRVGDVSRIPGGVVAGIGRNMTAIRPIDIPPVFLYYFFVSKDMDTQIRTNTDTGSFFGSLNVRGIKELKVTFSDVNMETIEAFEERIAPIRRMIEKLAEENRELTKLRDWLLPMLMNGQATVE